MNTFNMKQWLQANKVGPYAKTQLNESHEGNDQWIDQFHDALEAMKIDKWIKNQVLQMPSKDIIDLYGDMDAVRAAHTAVKEMFHSAREGVEMSEAKQLPYEHYEEEDEFEIGGVQYLADYVVMYDSFYDYDTKEFTFDMEAKLQKLYKAVGDEYTETNDPADIEAATKYINSDANLDKVSRRIEVPDPGDDESDLDDDSWMSEDRSDEQMGVGYAMKVKPSDPKY